MVNPERATVDGRNPFRTTLKAKETRAFLDTYRGIIRNQGF